jgi:hypothetical protein
MISTCPNDQHHQDGSGSIRLVPVGAGTMQESKPLVSVTNRSECHLESTILVWVSFRSIRDKIGPWRACCELAMGRDQNRGNLVDGGMVLVLGQDAGVLPTIVRGSSGTAQGIV